MKLKLVVFITHMISGTLWNKANLKWSQTLSLWKLSLSTLVNCIDLHAVSINTVSEESSNSVCNRTTLSPGPSVKIYSDDPGDTRHSYLLNDFISKSTMLSHFGNVTKLRALMVSFQRY